MSLSQQAFDNLVPVDPEHRWFRAYRLAEHVYAIGEPGHEERVHSFLVLGGERALLFDTGWAIEDMRRFVERITSLSVIVVNSHTHFDHMGDNYRWDTVYAADCDFARERMAKGWRTEEFDAYLADRCFTQDPPTPPEYNPKTHVIQPSSYLPAPDGHVFDLGGVRLRVLETPGHSPDSICLLDAEHRLLFTGDTLYPADLFAHMPESDLAVYAQSLERLNTLAGDLDWLLGSHGMPIRPVSDLAATVGLFRQVMNGRKPDGMPEPGVVAFEEGDIHLLARQDQLPEV